MIGAYHHDVPGDFHCGEGFTGHGTGVNIAGMGRDNGQCLLLYGGGRDQAVEAVPEGGGLSRVKLISNRRLSFHGGPPDAIEGNRRKMCFSIIAQKAKANQRDMRKKTD
jgi:hypothetical protein